MIFQLCEDFKVFLLQISLKEKHIIKTLEMKKSFFNKNETLVKKLSQVKDDSLIIFPHLGLGDQIINKGAINVVSKNFKKIYLVYWHNVVHI